MSSKTRSARWFAVPVAAVAIGAGAIAASGSSAASEQPASTPAAVNATSIASTASLPAAQGVRSTAFRDSAQYAIFGGPALSNPPSRLAEAAQADPTSVRKIPVPAGIASQVWAAQGPDGPCVLVQNPNGTGGVACAAPQSNEPPAVSLSGPDTGLKGTLIAGVVPDGVTAVAESLSDGGRLKINVSGNGFVASVPTQAAKLAGIEVPGFPSEAN